MKENKNLFRNVVVLAILIISIFALNSCTNNLSSSTIQSDVSEPTDIDLSYQQYKDDSQIYNGDIMIKYVTGELIRQYKPKKIINIITNTQETESAIIMITPNIEISNFRISKLNWTQGEFEVGEVLFEKEQLSTAEPIFIKIPIESVMNFKSISYTNIEGKQINLFIHKKESDGSLFVGKY
jgi:hypothetical protein